MLALIGGTGLNTLEGIAGFDLSHKKAIATPFADEAIQLSRYVYAGTELLFIPGQSSGAMPPIAFIATTRVAPARRSASILPR